MDSSTPKSELLEETAIRWFARQQRDDWTAADQAVLDAWLHAATAHRIHYMRVATAWEHSARMKALGAGVPAASIPARGSWGAARFPVKVSMASPSPNPDGCAPAANSHNSRARWIDWSLSAAVAVMVAVTGLHAAREGWFAGSRYSTAVGAMEELPLADGSRMTLNTDTRIRVSLTATERRIDLEQGEAFFDVTKDSSRPFVVHAGNQRVTAIGTKFAVRRDQDELQVVVTEGRVSLGTNAQQAGRAVGAPSVVFLDAGAVARTSDEEVIVRPDVAAEAEKLLSWRRGYVSFDNMALADAVAEFNRYEIRKIFIEDPAIASIRVGGNFRSGNSDAFLALLERGFPVLVEDRGDKVVLKAR